MTRPVAATLMGITFIIAYIVACVTIVDALPEHWIIRALYFMVAGVLWVLPVRWLMLWSVHRR